MRAVQGLYVMIQRIAVRLLLEHNGKLLLLRRADGRETILNKYELPGGRVFADEQPEDALRRYLRDDIGIDQRLEYTLSDVVTYTDADERDIQYAVVLYSGVLHDDKRAIRLGQHYDKFMWYHAGKLTADAMTNLTQFLLGTAPPTPVVSEKSVQEVSITPVLYTDGGSRGNPGPSAAGYILVDESGKTVGQGGEYIGITTNNQAEYHGLRIGLEAALAFGWRQLECRIDSMLVVNQLNGLYNIKNRELWPIFERIKQLISQFEKIKFVHVPRELNQLADGMVNKTLDAEKRERYNKEAAR